jgi:hypothetical protein
VLGIEGAKRQLELLSRQAGEYLAPFGERAALLQAAVDFVIKRRN